MRIDFGCGRLLKKGQGETIGIRIPAMLIKLGQRSREV